MVEQDFSFLIQLEDLAGQSISQQSYAEAVSYLSQSLSLRKTLYGEDSHRYRSRVFEAVQKVLPLALAQANRSDFSGSVRTLKALSALIPASLPAQRASVLNRLAESYRSGRRYEQAKAAAKEALRHPNGVPKRTLTFLNMTLARIYSDTGEPGKAISSWRRTAKIGQQALADVSTNSSEDSERLITAVALAYDRLGSLQDKGRFLNAAVAFLRKHAGPAQLPMLRQLQQQLAALPSKLSSASSQPSRLTLKGLTNRSKSPLVKAPFRTRRALKKRSPRSVLRKSLSVRAQLRRQPAKPSIPRLQARVRGMLERERLRLGRKRLVAIAGAKMGQFVLVGVIGKPTRGIIVTCRGVQYRAEAPPNAGLENVDFSPEGGIRIAEARALVKETQLIIRETPHTVLAYRRGRTIELLAINRRTLQRYAGLVTLNPGTDPGKYVQEMHIDIHGGHIVLQSSSQHPHTRTGHKQGPTLSQAIVRIQGLIRKHLSADTLRLRLASAKRPKLLRRQILAVSGTPLIVSVFPTELETLVRAHDPVRKLSHEFYVKSDPDVGALVDGLIYTDGKLGFASGSSQSRSSEQDEDSPLLKQKKLINGVQVVVSIFQQAATLFVQLTGGGVYLADRFTPQQLIEMYGSVPDPQVLFKDIQVSDGQILIRPSYHKSPRRWVLPPNEHTVILRTSKKASNKLFTIVMYLRRAAPDCESLRSDDTLLFQIYSDSYTKRTVAITLGKATEHTGIPADYLVPLGSYLIRHMLVITEYYVGFDTRVPALDLSTVATRLQAAYKGFLARKLLSASPSRPAPQRLASKRRVMAGKLYLVNAYERGGKIKLEALCKGEVLVCLLEVAELEVFEQVMSRLQAVENFIIPSLYILEQNDRKLLCIESNFTVAAQRLKHLQRSKKKPDKRALSVSPVSSLEILPRRQMTKRRV